MADSNSLLKERVEILKQIKQIQLEQGKKRKSDPSYTPEVYDIDIYAEYESIGGIIWKPVQENTEGLKKDEFWNYIVFQGV